MTTPKRATPAKVALKLSTLTISQRVSLANAVGIAMGGNAAFPAPPVTPGAIVALGKALEGAETAAKTARQTAAMRTSERDDALRAFDDGMTQVAAYVQSQSKGTKAVIDSAAMPVKGTPVRTTTAPAAPDPLAAVTGAKSGEAKLKWAGPAGAKTYVVERSVNPNDAASWTHVAATSKRTYVAQGLAAGRVWFRAAAVGAMGQGAWSDPATCVVT